MQDPTDYDRFNPSTTWQNFGDVNPEEHGGVFLRYDPDHAEWEIVKTTPLRDLDPDVDDPAMQMVETVGVQHSDVWVDGNPKQGVTDAMSRILESLHERGGRAGASPPGDSFRFMDNVDYYVADMVNQVSTHTETRSTDDYDDGYRGLLEAHGVNPDDAL